MLHLLSSLVDKSVITADLSASEPRYGQLELFREYARAKLEARGEAAIIAHRHALALLEIAKTWPRRTSSKTVCPGIRACGRKGKTGSPHCGGR